jgi:hypothetical protein
MKKLCYIPFLFLLVLVSCRKKAFPESEPVTQGDFYFTGNVDGRSVSLKAGIDNYYMYSSHVLDSSSIYRMVARLGPVDCESCNTGIRITIYDARYSSPGEALRVDSALTPGQYPVQGVPYYAVGFKSRFNKAAAAYLWDFGDNHRSSEPDPVHIYKSAGHYSVSLRIDAGNGCQQYISNQENIRYPMNRQEISTEYLSANTIRFKPLSADTLYNYQWNFGDGTYSGQVSVAHTYKVPGTYPVTLRMIQAGDTVYTRSNVATQTDPMPCLSNYEIVSVSRVLNPDPRSSVVIQWTDESGEVYTSRDIQQPETSSFRIVSVEDYEPNEKGEKTRRIKIRFTCRVYNGTRMKQINDAEALLAVSYR